MGRADGSEKETVSARRFRKKLRICGMKIAAPTRASNKKTMMKLDLLTTFPMSSVRPYILAPPACAPIIEACGRPILDCNRV